MRNMAGRIPKPRALPVARRKAGYAAPRMNAEDDYDNRVGEYIYDADDERAEVESIMHRLEHESH